MKFVINSKTYSATKVLSFIVNYGRELKMGVNIKKKEKMEKATEFAKKNKENLGESKSSTKESIRGNKEAGKQGRERGESMEEREQDYIEYERLSVQRVTSKEISGLICGSIYY